MKKLNRQMGAIIVLSSIFALLNAQGAEAESVAVSARGRSDVPEYHFKYSNGIYATVIGYLHPPKAKDSHFDTYTLHVPGFKKELSVFAAMQPCRAPLVVILPGMFSTFDTPCAKLWAQWFEEAGYHVMVMDSTFLSRFNAAAHLGASGNLEVETDAASRVILAFTQLEPFKSQITKIGVVGMSYSGAEALMMGRMARENRLPFKLDAVQAYSPPVNFAHTGEILDEWYACDRMQFTQTEFSLILARHKPVANDAAIPFTNSLLRAAIADSLHEDLSKVVLENNQAYNLCLLTGSAPRSEYAKTWSFHRFMYDLSFPYWQARQDLSSFQDFLAPMLLEGLLKDQPQNCEAILAEDDPLNDSADTAELCQNAAHLPLTLLPHGGHMGYATYPWTQAKLLSLFNAAPAQNVSVPSGMAAQ